MLRATFATLLILGAADVAFAATKINGQRLLEECNKLDTTFCKAYIQGVIDGVESGVEGALLFRQRKPNDGDTVREFTRVFRGFCFTPNLTTDATIETAIKFLKEYPELEKHTAHSIVVAAMHRNYPCNK